MIDLLLVKRDMLRYVQDGKRMGRGLTDLHVLLCIVRAWMKRGEFAVWATRIRSEKLGEHQYREGYPRYLEVRN